MHVETIPEDIALQPVQPSRRRRKSPSPLAESVQEQPKRRRSKRISGDKDTTQASLSPPIAHRPKRTSTRTNAPQPVQAKARSRKNAQASSQNGHGPPQVEEEEEDEEPGKVPHAESRKGKVHARNVERERDHSPSFSEDDQLAVTKIRDGTQIPLPLSDTPVIRRNKAMRLGGGRSSAGGRRRSSAGLRGRRASSLIESGNSNGRDNQGASSIDVNYCIGSLGLRRTTCG